MTSPKSASTRTTSLSTTRVVATDTTRYDKQYNVHTAYCLPFNMRSCLSLLYQWMHKFFQTMHSTRLGCEKAARDSATYNNKPGKSGLSSHHIDSRLPLSSRSRMWRYSNEHHSSIPSIDGSMTLKKLAQNWFSRWLASWCMNMVQGCRNFGFSTMTQNVSIINLDITHLDKSISGFRTGSCWFARLSKFCLLGWRRG